MLGKSKTMKIKNFIPPVNCFMPPFLIFPADFLRTQSTLEWKEETMNIILQIHVITYDARCFVCLKSENYIKYLVILKTKLNLYLKHMLIKQ